MENSGRIWAVEHAIRTIMQQYGLDCEDPELSETPNRVARAFDELMLPSDEDRDKAVKEILSRSFVAESDPMVFIGPVEAVMLCPHHLLAAELSVVVAYVPHGKVLGLSKIPRVVKEAARRPMLQEEYASYLADAFMNWVGEDEERDQFAAITSHSTHPKGCGVVVIGRHSCCNLRGVKSLGTVMQTNSLRGCFLDEPDTRSEFLAQANMRVTL